MTENVYPSSAGPDSIDIAIGTRLRLRRLALGLSQQTLADALGITFQQIQKYERGTNRVFASRLFHLARALKVPVAYFFSGVGSEGETRSPEAGAKTAAAAEGETVEDLLGKSDALKLIRAFNRIEDPSVRRQIYVLVKTVGEQTGLGSRFR